MKKAIKKFLKNDIVERCYKTFFQAFIGMFLTIEFFNIENFDSFKRFIAACIITGVCSVWNILKDEITKLLNKLKERK